LAPWWEKRTRRCILTSLSLSLSLRFVLVGRVVKNLLSRCRGKLIAYQPHLISSTVTTIHANVSNVLFYSSLLLSRAIRNKGLVTEFCLVAARLKPNAGLAGNCRDLLPAAPMLCSRVLSNLYLLPLLLITGLFPQPQPCKIVPRNKYIIRWTTKHANGSC
jgi:hypothetical protein